MKTALHVTRRDDELLEALCLKVRLFGQRQIADGFFEGELANARRRLKQLAANELLVRISVQARAVSALESPLASWQPGDSEPDFGQVAYRCQNRWRQRPTRLCSAWMASEKAAQLYGGVRRGELKNPMQATHDLGVAAVWLRLRQVAPAWAVAWRGEDLLAQTRVGEKLPDAFIVDAQGQVSWVVEFGGGYDSNRVQAFHEDCAQRSLPYHLW